MGANKAKLAARKAVLRGFQAFCDTHGRAPSYRELGSELGYSSPQAVTNVVRRLIADGMIVARPRVVQKADRISAAGQRWLAQTDE